MMELHIYSMFCSLNYWQDCTKGTSVGVVFTHGLIFPFFATRVTHCTDQGEIWQAGPMVRSSLPNFTLIG